MPRVEIELPDELVDELQPYQHRLAELLRLGLEQTRLAEALKQYERGLVSLARAAELAGVPREELMLRARAAGIIPRWSDTMAIEELA